MPHPQDCPFHAPHLFTVQTEIQWRWNNDGVSAELDVNPGLELRRMSPKEIQGKTMPYGQRTLSIAMSSIPERNGASRLDEIMSGVVGVDMLIE